MPENIKNKKEVKIFEPKILVFACNWCSYAGADNAGVGRMEYSPNVRLLRTMCSGRVHPSYVLKAFANGADGVIVSGCHFGDCHYMFGNYRAEEQYFKLEKLVDILGIEPERITLEWISAAEGPRFASVINGFVDKIRELGPAHFSKNGKDKSEAADTVNLQEYKMFECLECGRCTSACPVSVTHKFSPRRIISQAVARGTEAIKYDSSVWACLSCKKCETVCPSDIPYSEMNIRLRTILKEAGTNNLCTHGGVFEEVQHIMTNPEIKQKRWGWLKKNIKINDTKSDTLFFTGCAPYFAAYFGDDYEEKLTGSMNSVIKLMNKIGIEPKVLENEICCGHDALLRGDRNEFEELARLSMKQVWDSRVKRIVFNCPECLVTYRDEYPKIFGELNLELVHTSELLEENIEKFEFKKSKLKVSYQDPCRLGRYSKIYDQPRNILKSIPGLEFTEMNHNKSGAICCGNTAWINCDGGTRELQNIRLAEAAETGCNQLLTACPKCLIHLNCSQNGNGEDDKKTIEVNDIWNFFESHIK